MRALIQRVSKAAVQIKDRPRAEIGHGLVIFLGVGKLDTETDAIMLADKISKLRIFSNQEGKFHYSVFDIKGETLIISQFTLYAETSGGRRPDFIQAAGPEQARPLYDFFVKEIQARGLTAKTGVFAADMSVEIVNDGPVTIWLDSKS